MSSNIPTSLAKHPACADSALEGDQYKTQQHNEQSGEDDKKEIKKKNIGGKDNNDTVQSGMGAVPPHLRIGPMPFANDQDILG